MLVSAAIEKFLTDLSIVKAQRTVKAYRTPLTCLPAALGDVDTQDINAQAVPSFVRWLHEYRDLNQNTLNLYLVALTRFYKWLVLSDLAPNDSLRFEDWVRQYHKPDKKRPPKLPSEEDVRKLLDTVRASRPTPEKPDTEAGQKMTLRYLRDLAILETLRCTGCRVEEALSLLNGDVKDKYATVTGKGDKERVVFWDEAGWQAVSEYMALKNGQPSDPLFVRHDWRWRKDNERVCTNTARAIMAEWCRKAKVKVMTPHQFRHRFATMLLRETKNLAAVQDLLGHASPQTTRIYAQFTDTELREAHDSVKL